MTWQYGFLHQVLTYDLTSFKFSPTTHTTNNFKTVRNPESCAFILPFFGLWGKTSSIPSYSPRPVLAPLKIVQVFRGQQQCCRQRIGFKQFYESMQHIVTTQIRTHTNYKILNISRGATCGKIAGKVNPDDYRASFKVTYNKGLIL